MLSLKPRTPLSYHNLLLKVKDSEMEAFGRYVVDSLPKYSLIPSSRSGKYHPKDEFKVGGQLLHVSRVVKVMEHLLERDGVTDQNTKNLMILTAILHDVNKAIDARDEACGPEFLKDSMVSYFGEGKTWPWWCKQLVEFVTVHGGRWTPVDSKYVYNPQDRYHSWIHTADYMASRNNIRWTDDPDPNPRWKWVTKLRQKWIERALNG